MAVNPIDIDSLKPEDVVVTSTPQQRNVEAKEEPKVDPPTEEGKVEEVKLTDEQIDARIAELDEKDDADLTEEERLFVEQYTVPAEEIPADDEDEVDWEAISEEVGIDVRDDDDVIAGLKELAEYKSLSPALQKAIEIERAEGDVAAYFKSLAVDPEGLSDRDALWEQYVIDNPKRVASNPQFARMDFDRKLDKEYSLLNEYEKLPASEQEYFLEEHKAEIEYLKEKRKFDADSARATLQEKQEEIVFKEVKKPGEAAPDPNMQELIRNHEVNYRKAIAEFDVVSLNMGKDFEFNVGLGESNKEQAIAWMKNPESFLAEIGFYAGKIDYDKMAGWAALIADIKYGNFGERIRQAILDNKDINTLERTLDAPGIIKTGGEKPILQGDEWDAIGNAFEQKRMEAKKKR